MTTAPTEEEILLAALKSVPSRPTDDKRASKQKWSQTLSTVLALAFSDMLRRRGMSDVRPTAPGAVGGSGAERRIAGAIGAKKVDVSWATEESGLLVGMSIKTINFKDKKSGNYQKNLTNRRGDMLFESVTLHKRFPYAVLVGIFAFDKGADEDDTEKRNSTFRNAHHSLRLFTGRDDPDSREEQYELLFLALHDTNPFSPSMSFYEAGAPDVEVDIKAVVDRVVALVADRNPDLYSEKEGRLVESR